MKKTDKKVKEYIDRAFEIAKTLIPLTKQFTDEAREMRIKVHVIEIAKMIQKEELKNE